MKKTFIHLTMLCLLGAFVCACNSRKSQGDGNISQSVEQIESVDGSPLAYYEAESGLQGLTMWSYENENDYLASILSQNYFPQDGFNMYLMMSLLYTPVPAVETKRILAGVALYAIDFKPQYSSNTACLFVKFGDGEFEKWDGGLIRNGRFFVFDKSEEFIAKLKRTNKCVVATSKNSSFVFDTHGLEWNY